jgi:hypothetical protein
VGARPASWFGPVTVAVQDSVGVLARNGSVEPVGPQCPMTGFVGRVAVWRSSKDGWRIARGGSPYGRLEARLDRFGLNWRRDLAPTVQESARRSSRLGTSVPAKLAIYAVRQSRCQPTTCTTFGEDAAKRNLTTVRCHTVTSEPELGP